MALHRMRRDRRAFVSGSPGSPLADAFDFRDAATARVVRELSACADPSFGYGVWQNAQTRRLLLSLPHFGHSIA